MLGLVRRLLSSASSTTDAAPSPPSSFAPAARSSRSDPNAEVPAQCPSSLSLSSPRPGGEVPPLKPCWSPIPDAEGSRADADADGYRSPGLLDLSTVAVTSFSGPAAEVSTTAGTAPGSSASSTRHFSTLVTADIDGGAGAPRPHDGSDDEVDDFLNNVIAGKTDVLRKQLAQQKLEAAAAAAAASFNGNFSVNASAQSGLQASMLAAVGESRSPMAVSAAFEKSSFVNTPAPSAGSPLNSAGSPHNGSVPVERRVTVNASTPSPAQQQPQQAALAASQRRPRYVSSAARSLQDYELIAFLGKGTFAEVTLARNKVTGEYFAVKKISKQRVKEEGCVERTFTERQLLANLHHPFLVRLYQAFQSQTHLYLVLDFAQGGDLYYLNMQQLWLRSMKRSLVKMQYPYYQSTSSTFAPLLVTVPPPAATSSGALSCTPTPPPPAGGDREMMSTSSMAAADANSTAATGRAAGLPLPVPVPNLLEALPHQQQLQLHPPSASSSSSVPAASALHSATSLALPPLAPVLTSPSLMASTTTAAGAAAAAASAAAATLAAPASTSTSTLATPQVSLTTVLHRSSPPPCSASTTAGAGSLLAAAASALSVVDGVAALEDMAPPPPPAAAASAAAGRAHTPARSNSDSDDNEDDGDAAGLRLSPTTGDAAARAEARAVRRSRQLDDLRYYTTDAVDEFASHRTRRVAAAAAAELMRANAKDTKDDTEANAADSAESAGSPTTITTSLSPQTPEPLRRAALATPVAVAAPDSGLGSEETPTARDGEAPSSGPATLLSTPTASRDHNQHRRRRHTSKPGTFPGYAVSSSSCDDDSESGKGRFADDALRGDRRSVAVHGGSSSRDRAPPSRRPSQLQQRRGSGAGDGSLLEYPPPSAGGGAAGAAAAHLPTPLSTPAPPRRRRSTGNSVVAGAAGGLPSTGLSSLNASLTATPCDKTVTAAGTPNTQAVPATALPTPLRGVCEAVASSRGDAVAPNALRDGKQPSSETPAMLEETGGGAAAATAAAPASPTAGSTALPKRKRRNRAAPTAAAAAPSDAAAGPESDALAASPSVSVTGDAGAGATRKKARKASKMKVTGPETGDGGSPLVGDASTIAAAAASASQRSAGTSSPTGKTARKAKKLAAAARATGANSSSSPHAGLAGGAGAAEDASTSFTNTTDAALAPSASVTTTILQHEGAAPGAGAGGGVGYGGVPGFGATAAQDAAATAAALRVELAAPFHAVGMEGSSSVLRAASSEQFAPDETHRLPLRLIAFYAVEVALVLQYLHGEGFLYRDLKPENILMRSDGHVMLTDFGVAKYRKGAAIVPTAAAASSSANSADAPASPLANAGAAATPNQPTGQSTDGRANSFTGTTQYMSPEMLRGLPHDSRTDWWSYGCLLFEWANGRKAFDAANQFVLFRSIVEEDVKVTKADYRLTALEVHTRVAQLHYRAEEIRIECEERAMRRMKRSFAASSSHGPRLAMPSVTTEVLYNPENRSFDVRLLSPPAAVVHAASMSRPPDKPASAQEGDVADDPCPQRRVAGATGQTPPTYPQSPQQHHHHQPRPSMHAHKQQHQYRAYPQSATAGLSAALLQSPHQQQQQQPPLPLSDSFAAGSFAGMAPNPVLSFCGTPTNLSMQLTTTEDGGIAALLSSAKPTTAAQQQQERVRRHQRRRMRLSCLALDEATRDRYIGNAVAQMEEAQELLRDLTLKLLDRRVEHRLSGDAVLQHPFFTCGYVVSQLYYHVYQQRVLATEMRRSVSTAFASTTSLADLVASTRDDALETNTSMGAPSLATAPPQQQQQQPGTASSASFAASFAAAAAAGSTAGSHLFSSFPTVPLPSQSRPVDWRELFLERRIRALYAPRLRARDDLRYFPAAVTATGLSAAVEQQRRLREVKEQQKEYIMMRANKVAAAAAAAATAAAANGTNLSFSSASFAGAISGMHAGFGAAGGAGGVGAGGMAATGNGSSSSGSPHATGAGGAASGSIATAATLHGDAVMLVPLDEGAAQQVQQMLAAGSRSGSQAALPSAVASGSPAQAVEAEGGFGALQAAVPAAGMSPLPPTLGELDDDVTGSGGIGVLHGAHPAHLLEPHAQQRQLPPVEVDASMSVLADVIGSPQTPAAGPGEAGATAVRGFAHLAHPRHPDAPIADGAADVFCTPHGRSAGSVVSVLGTREAATESATPARRPPTRSQDASPLSPSPGDPASGAPVDDSTSAEWAAGSVRQQSDTPDPADTSLLTMSTRTPEAMRGRDVLSGLTSRSTSPKDAALAPSQGLPLVTSANGSGVLRAAPAAKAAATSSSSDTTAASAIASAAAAAAAAGTDKRGESHGDLFDRAATLPQSFVDAALAVAAAAQKKQQQQQLRSAAAAAAAAAAGGVEAPSAVGSLIAPSLAHASSFDGSTKPVAEETAAPGRAPPLCGSEQAAAATLPATAVVLPPPPAKSVGADAAPGALAAAAAAVATTTQGGSPVAVAAEPQWERAERCVAAAAGAVAIGPHATPHNAPPPHRGADGHDAGAAVDDDDEDEDEHAGGGGYYEPDALAEDEHESHPHAAAAESSEHQRGLTAATAETADGMTGTAELESTESTSVLADGHAAGATTTTLGFSCLDSPGSVTPAHNPVHLSPSLTSYSGSIGGGGGGSAWQSHDATANPLSPFSGRDDEYDTATNTTGESTTAPQTPETAAAAAADPLSLFGGSGHESSVPPMVTALPVALASAAAATAACSASHASHLSSSASNTMDFRSDDAGRHLDDDDDDEHEAGNESAVAPSFAYSPSTSAVPLVATRSRSPEGLDPALPCGTPAHTVTTGATGEGVGTPSVPAAAVASLTSALTATTMMTETTMLAATDVSLANSVRSGSMSLASGRGAGAGPSRCGIGTGLHAGGDWATSPSNNTTGFSTTPGSMTAVDDADAQLGPPLPRHTFAFAAGSSSSSGESHPRRRASRAHQHHSAPHDLHHRTHDEHLQSSPDAAEGSARDSDGKAPSALLSTQRPNATRTTRSMETDASRASTGSTTTTTTTTPANDEADVVRGQADTHRRRDPSSSTAVTSLMTSRSASQDAQTAEHAEPMSVSMSPTTEQILCGTHAGISAPGSIGVASPTGRSSSRDFGGAPASAASATATAGSAAAAPAAAAAHVSGEDDEEEEGVADERGYETSGGEDTRTSDDADAASSAADAADADDGDVDDEEEEEEEEESDDEETEGSTESGDDAASTSSAPPEGSAGVGVATAAGAEDKRTCGHCDLDGSLRDSITNAIVAASAAAAAAAVDGVDNSSVLGSSSPISSTTSSTSARTFTQSSGRSRSCASASTASSGSAHVESGRAARRARRRRRSTCAACEDSDQGDEGDARVHNGDEGGADGDTTAAAASDAAYRTSPMHHHATSRSGDGGAGEGSFRGVAQHLTSPVAVGRPRYSHSHTSSPSPQSSPRAVLGRGGERHLPYRYVAHLGGSGVGDAGGGGSFSGTDIISAGGGGTSRGGGGGGRHGSPTAHGGRHAQQQLDSSSSGSHFYSNAFGSSFSVDTLGGTTGGISLGGVGGSGVGITAVDLLGGGLGGLGGASVNSVGEGGELFGPLTTLSGIAYNVDDEASMASLPGAPLTAPGVTSDRASTAGPTPPLPLPSQGGVGAGGPPAAGDRRGAQAMWAQQQRKRIARGLHQQQPPQPPLPQQYPRAPLPDTPPAASSAVLGRGGAIPPVSAPRGGFNDGRFGDANPLSSSGVFGSTAGNDFAGFTFNDAGAARLLGRCRDDADGFDPFHQPQRAPPQRQPHQPRTSYAHGGSASAGLPPRRGAPSQPLHAGLPYHYHQGGVEPVSDEDEADDVIAAHMRPHPQQHPHQSHRRHDAGGLGAAEQRHSSSSQSGNEGQRGGTGDGRTSDGSNSGGGGGLGGAVSGGGFDHFQNFSFTSPQILQQYLATTRGDSSDGCGGGRPAPYARTRRGDA